MSLTFFTLFIVALTATMTPALPILRRADAASSVDSLAVTSTFAPSSSSSSLPSSTTILASSNEPPKPSPTTTPTSNGKFVVAHHMVGNTFPYTRQNWAEDIALAHSASIDGFALNMGSDEWQPARVNDAYEAAIESQTGFKMFLSLDMASLPCNSPEDAARLRQIVLAHIDHPSQFKYSSDPSTPPRAFVSTFAGESCSFGSGSPASAWFTQFYDHPELKDKIHFVPSFFVDPQEFQEGKEWSKVMDGTFHWNGAWPVELTTDKVKSEGGVLGGIGDGIGSHAKQSAEGALGLLGKFLGSTNSDRPYLNAIGRNGNAVQARDGKRKTYMASVSPWFFTHYGQDSFNKNFLYVSDHNLLSHRFEALLAPETVSSVDIIQALSWNDFGESHYFGPIKGDQPNSQAWVDGFDHTGWLTIIRHFSQQFKGQQTNQGDAIIAWARPHKATAQADDPVGQPKNFELVEDQMWAAVFAAEPSTITLASSSALSGEVVREEVPAGLTLVSRPLNVGDSLYARLEKTSGGPAVELDAKDRFVFRDRAEKGFNFNVAVFSSGDVIRTD